MSVTPDQAAPYSSYVLPPQQKVRRWSLTMAWWALFSAMFWIYIAVASAGAVGVPNTIVGMVLSIATYGAINMVLTKFAAKTGLSVEEFSRTLFGLIGSALATLIFAATAIYYAVFEGSIIAVALESFFGGSRIMWYAIVVAYAIPLVAGGVQNWLDKLNGFLLPLYLAGLAAVVIAATAIRGIPTDWIGSAAAASPLPGWVTAYLIYMGVWVMMMYTFDYARLGKQQDEKFHATVSFGWVFYAFTFGLNGFVGIYIMSAWNLQATETGVVQGFISSLGFFGLLVILISQTRINTANYYLASLNLGAFMERAFNLRLPRFVWVLVSGAIAFLFMLTDVLSYLLKALAWQGVFVTAWVAVALVYIAMHRNSLGVLPEVRPEKLRPISAGAVAWLVASGTGIFLTEQTASPLAAQFAPLITVALAGGLYYVAHRLQAPPAISTADAEVLAAGPHEDKAAAHL
ncbi:purine-cytosine permease family protein [Arthrobacter ramosus]|uniref:Purine-cytosine permease family protein n=1 Tax=Arthrobacter ramosus TaxID=1672 RepID=A0ABV5Y585_ARTRM|nr:permease [Arthrobacter ramosus]